MKAFIATILIITSFIQAGTETPKDKDVVTPANSPTKKSTTTPEDLTVKDVTLMVEKSFGFLWIIKYSNIRLYVNKDKDSKPIAEHSLWYFWSSYQDKIASAALKLKARLSISEMKGEETQGPNEISNSVLTFGDVSKVNELTVNNVEFQSCVGAKEMSAKFENGAWDKDNKDTYNLDMNVLCKLNPMQSFMKKGSKKIADKVLKGSLKDKMKPILEKIVQDHMPSNEESVDTTPILKKNTLEDSQFEEEEEELSQSHLKNSEDMEHKIDSYSEPQDSKVQPMNLVKGYIADKMAKKSEVSDLHKDNQFEEIEDQESLKKSTPELLNQSNHDVHLTQSQEDALNQSQDYALDQSKDDSFKFDNQVIVKNSPSKQKIIL